MRPLTRRRRTEVLVALLLAVLVGGVACSEPNPPYTDRAALEKYLSRAPGVPLVLPRSLPEAYAFLGPGYEQSEDDRMVVRSVDFRSDAAATSTVVELCVADPGSPVDACVPSGAEDQTVTRQLGAYPVWVRPLGADVLTAQERTFWAAVPLTDDLDEVDWLT